MLSCQCESAPEWYYDFFDFAAYDKVRGKKCCSCKIMLKSGDICLEIKRDRYPKDDIEEKIYGDYIPLASWYMCEKCGEIFMNLADIGYCLHIDNNMNEYLKEYQTMTGFKQKVK